MSLRKERYFICWKNKKDKHGKPLRYVTGWFNIYVEAKEFFDEIDRYDRINLSIYDTKFREVLK